MQVVKSPNKTFFIFVVLIIFACSTSGIETTPGQQVATLIENCKGIEVEVLQNNTPNYVKLRCQDGISMINKVCEFILSPSVIKAYTSCSSSKLLQSFLNTVGLDYEILYEDKCAYRSAMHENSSEISNPFLNFMLDAVTYFRLQTTVVIIDSYTGVSPLKLQKMLSTMNTAAIIINLDAEDAMIKKLQRKNRFVNFIVACGEHHLPSLIEHVEGTELFNFPYFWLILTENASRVERIMVDEVKVDYTWNITVAEVIPVNSDDTPLSHSSVFTEIFMATNPSLMERLNAACCSKKFPAYLEPQKSHKHTDSTKEGDIGYTLYDYRVRCQGKLEKIKFGNWTKEVGFKVDKFDPLTRMSLKGCNFTIALGRISPYVKIGINDFTATGLDIDILKILATKLEFNYNFKYTNFTTLGTRTPNGSWTNVFKILTEDKSVDFILPTADVTPARSASMHFTARLTEISGSVVIMTPNSNVEIDDYIRPFSGQVWFVLAICILLISVCLSLTYLISPFGKPNPRQHGQLGEEEYIQYPNYSWQNSFFVTCSAVLQQGTDISPRYISGRIIFATVFATSVLIIQSYSSLLISFLTTNVQKVPFRNVKELAESRDYSIGLIASAHFAEVLNSSDDEYFRKIWSKISSKQDNIVDKLSAGLEKAMKEKYALLVPDTSVNWLLRKNCSYTAPLTKILKSFKCIAARKHFPYISVFSTVINNLRETGVIKQLYQRYLPDIKSSCRDKMEHQQIDFFNILFLIYLFVAGLVISLVMILIECCLHQYQKWSANKQLKSKKQKPLPWIPATLTRPKLKTVYIDGTRSNTKN